MNFGFIQLNVAHNTETVVFILERRPEKEINKLNLNPITFYIKHSDAFPQGRKELRGLLGQVRDIVQGSGDTETFHGKHDWKWRMYRHFYDVVKQFNSLTFC